MTYRDVVTTSKFIAVLSPNNSTMTGDSEDTQGHLDDADAFMITTANWPRHRRRKLKSPPDNMQANSQSLPNKGKDQTLRFDHI